MNEVNPTEFIRLEKSPMEMFAVLSRELSEEAEDALIYIKQDGMGVKKIDRINPTTYFIEHSPFSSGDDIARYLGYIAQDDWRTSVEMLNPDNQPHAIQLKPFED